MKAFWQFFIASGVWYPMLATSLLFLPLAAICCANGKWWGGLIIAEPWIIAWAPIYADYRIYRKQTVPQVRIALTEEEVKLGLQADLEDWDERYKNSLPLAELRSRSTRNG